MNKYFIGLSTTYHDPSIAIINPKGEVVFAEGTERYLQYKKALSCPADSYARVSQLIKEYCDPKAEYVIATSWSKESHEEEKRMFNEGFFDPSSYFSKSANAASEHLARPFVIKWSLLQHFGTWVKSGSSFAYKLNNEFKVKKVNFLHCSHHLTHATYACMASKLDDALCVVVDGHGDVGKSITAYTYENNKINELKGKSSFDSFGTFYSMITDFCGFDTRMGEEWKVMGLAPYGELDQQLYKTLNSIVSIKDYQLTFSSKRTMLKALDHIKTYVKKNGPDPYQLANLAFTGQKVFSEKLSELLMKFKKLTGKEHLIFTGGCALNSSFNGRLLEYTDFRSFFTPSAPADDGNSVGAAFLAYKKANGKFPDKKKGNIISPYLGSTTSKKILNHLVKFSGIKTLKKLSKSEMNKTLAKHLAKGKLIGIMRGKAEFGPRALGNRSILADPRSKKMKDTINSKVKFREEFRPFAPSILHQFGDEYFENYAESPYMERTLHFKKEVYDKVPAVVHEDGTGRLQSVKKEWNKDYYNLIQEFYRLTGVPVLLNTSFNVMGKPIVHSVEDALSVFFTSGLDVLVIENILITKN